MTGDFRLSYRECRALLTQRLAESPPARIQLLSGPRHVGKTTLLLELAEASGRKALYAAADGPEAALPGFWERLWVHAAEVAAAEGQAAVLLDEVHLLHDWAARLKGEWIAFAVDASQSTSSPLAHRVCGSGPDRERASRVVSSG